MPQVIPAITAALTAAKTWLAATTIGKFVVANALFFKVATIAATITYSAVQSRKARKAAKASLNQGRTFMVRGGTEPRQLIYGEVRTSGVFYPIDTTGTDNEYFHFLVLIAGHECQSIDTIYFDDDEVTLDGSGNVTTSPYNGFARVKIHLGTAAQTADSDLVSESGEWTTNHRLRGITYLYVRLKWSSEVFPSGWPNVSCIVKGKKVYDSRTSTTAYSNNWALCLADYLTDTALGLGHAVADLDDTALQAAANVADESVTLDPSGTESRYTVNGVVLSDAQPGDVIDQLNRAGAGFCGYIGGKWVIHAGAYRTPTVTFDENDLRAPISVQTKVSRREIFNGGKGIYMSPDNQWQPADYPPVVNSTYTTEDGGTRIWQDFEWPFTTSNATVQRLTKIALERVRQQIQFWAPMKLTGMQCQAGDNVMWNNDRLGWSGKVFEVVECKFAPEQQEDGIALGVDCLFRETASGVWDWANGEETTVDLAPNTNLPDPRTVAAPTGLTLTSDGTTTGQQPDGATTSRILVEWTAPADQFVKSGGRIRIEYKLSAASTWNHWDTIRGDETEAYITAVMIGLAYDVRIRAENNLGIGSSWVDDSVTAAGDTTAPSTPTGLTATAGERLITLDWADNTDADLGEYAVYRHTSNSFGTSTQIAQVRASRFVDTTPTPSTTYYYWITAIDRSENESSASTVASAAADDDLSTALSDAAQAISDAASAQGTADGKVTTFFQTSAPTAEGVGDLWIDTDDDNKLYRWNGSSWVSVRDAGIADAIADAATAQSTADGKIVTFYQTSAPTAGAVGDLWVDTDDGNRLYRWNGSSWVDVQGIKTDTPSTPSAPTYNTSGTYSGGDGTVFAYIVINTPALPSGAAGINVLYRVNGSSQWIIADQTDAGSGTARVDDLAPGVTYQFAVQAFSNFGILSTISTALSQAAPNKTSGPSAPTSVAITPNGPLPKVWPPTGALMYAGRVSWTPPSDKDVAYYEVKATSTNSDAATDYSWSRADGGSSLERTAETYIDLYSTNISFVGWVRVRAVDHTGNASSWATGASMPTGAGLPAGTIMGQDSDDLLVTGQTVGGGGSTPKILTRAAVNKSGTLTGGTPGEAIDISLSGLGFSTKPDGPSGGVSVNSDNLLWRYDWDSASSTSTNARCSVFTRDGTNIAGSAAYRIQTEFFEED